MGRWKQRLLKKRNLEEQMQAAEDAVSRGTSAMLTVEGPMALEVMAHQYILNKKSRRVRQVWVLLGYLCLCVRVGCSVCTQLSGHCTHVRLSLSSCLTAIVYTCPLTSPPVCCLSPEFLSLLLSSGTAGRAR